MEVKGRLLRQGEFNESLYLSEYGHVADTQSMNIFLVSSANGKTKLLTHPFDFTVFETPLRNFVGKLASRNNWELEEKLIKKEDLLSKLKDGEITEVLGTNQYAEVVRFEKLKVDNLITNFSSKKVYEFLDSTVKRELFDLENKETMLKI